MDDDAEYGLLVSFEDQSASFVHGFEAGQLWQRMRDGTEAEISATIHTANRETVTRMALAEGWVATFTETEVAEWLTLEVAKTKKAPERPNPHGLRVVN